jgi:cell division protein FtsQ
VETVSWVEGAKVVRLLPDTLVIAVTERRPLAVWQSRGRLALVDAQGQVITGADAAKFPQLPLVVGPGAGEAAGAVLPLLHARPKLMEQIEALVRVDRRRWDLRLRDGALIQLPALDEADALMRLDQLEQRSQVLSLGFAKIDLRDPELIAVRPRGDRPQPKTNALPAGVLPPAVQPAPVTPVPPAAPAAAAR